MKCGEEYIGVVRKDEQWMSYFEMNNKRIPTGLYRSAAAAALGRDMELLRRFGERAEDLNFEYEIVESTDKELVLLDSRKLKIVIPLPHNNNLDDEVVVPANPKLHQYREVLTAPLVLPDNHQSHVYSTLTPWIERLQNAYCASTTYTYEISFPHQNSLGLNLKPHSLMFSQSGGSQSMGCLTIVDATPFLASIICPGDLLVKINDTDLALPGHLFDFDKATRAILTSLPPRVLRFVRPARPGAITSIAEMRSIIRDYPPTAKFQVVLNGSTQTLQLISIDPMAPAMIKKQMQGQKVQWEVNPTPSRTTPAPVKKYPSVDPDSLTDVAVGNYLVTGLMYKDRLYSAAFSGAGGFTGATPGSAAYSTFNSGIDNLNNTTGTAVTWGKWCVYITVEKNINSDDDNARRAKRDLTRIYMVGKYNYEEEAKLNMSKAVEIASQLGYFPSNGIGGRKRVKQLTVTPSAASTATSEDVTISSEAVQQLSGAAPAQAKLVIRRNINAVSNTTVPGAAAVK